MREKKHQDKKKAKDSKPPEVPLMTEVTKLVEPIMNKYMALMDKFEPFRGRKLQEKDFLKLISLIEELNEVFARLMPFMAQLIAWNKGMAQINEFHKLLGEALNTNK